MEAESGRKLQEVFARAKATIGDKTSAIVGGVQTKTQTIMLKREIGELTDALGRAYYAQWAAGDADQASIARLCERIKEKQDAVAALDSGPPAAGATRAVGFTCPRCHASFDTPTAFCRKCGCKMAGD